MRLPKCASTSFVDLLRKLSKLSTFHLEFNPSGAYNWKDDEMYSVARQCISRLRLNQNIVYARHFYFVDFTSYKIKIFSYVTMIRDPIARVVSSYLYYHFSSKKNIQKILNQDHKNESLSTCVRQQHEGCQHNLVTKYFCGHDHWCQNGDKRALETAKNNLKNHFAVVGIMEEMKLSINLMKRILPQFFAAAGMGDLTLSSLNKNAKTTSLTEQEKMDIATANSADLELYAYAVELLHHQASSCGIEC